MNAFPTSSPSSTPGSARATTSCPIARSMPSSPRSEDITAGCLAPPRGGAKNEPHGVVSAVACRATKLVAHGRERGVGGDLVDRARSEIGAFAVLAGGAVGSTLRHPPPDTA